MNNTTTITPITNATTSSSLDHLYSLFVNPVSVVLLYQIGYSITFLLGFLGNVLSLITFSRSTLRKISTGCLFILLAISDTLYLFICIFDFLEFGLQIPFYHHVQYDELCRFRSFVASVSQVLSSWLLVTVSVDRWIRTRFPFKSASLCTPKKALLVVCVLLIIDIGLYSHILSPWYGTLIPGIARAACGPTLSSRSYFLFYYIQWAVVEIFMISLIPVIIMMLILIDIVISVRIRKRTVIQPSQTLRENNKANQQRDIQLQMFILTLTSIGIFLITTLPISVYKITAPREVLVFLSSFYQVVTVWTGLGWFQSLNYALNFYIHCLTSRLFRKEFKQQMKFICGRKQIRVDVIELNKRVQHPQVNQQ